MSALEDLKYTPEHEWVLIDGDVATIGITDFAADALGDVVYLDLPEIGTEIKAGDVVGEIESTKSVSELYAPLSGEVIAVNTDAADDPSLVNQSPFDAAWLIKLRVRGDADGLIDRDAYLALTEG